MSHLSGWGRLRVEVTEEATSRTEGERYSVTPRLGVYRAVVGVHGDIQVPEERLRGAIARAALSGAGLEDELTTLLDEPPARAGDDPVLLERDQAVVELLYGRDRKSVV